MDLAGRVGGDVQLDGLAGLDLDPLAVGGDGVAVERDVDDRAVGRLELDSLADGLLADGLLADGLAVVLSGSSDRSR